MPQVTEGLLIFSIIFRLCFNLKSFYCYVFKFIDIFFNGVKTTVKLSLIFYFKYYIFMIIINSSFNFVSFLYFQFPAETVYFNKTFYIFVSEIYMMKHVLLTTLKSLSVNSKTSVSTLASVVLIHSV